MAGKECIFCKIVAGEIPSRKIYEDEFVYAFYDINPEAPHHYLITPKKHIASIDDIMPEDLELVGKLFLAAQAIARTNKLKENSYRLVFNNGRLAGQTVYHIHMHFLAGRMLHWPPG